MMFFKVISKIKYRCLITLLGCIALLMAGCGGKDEAIILLPSGESAAEYPELEAVEQVAETVDNNVALSTAETINRTQMCMSMSVGPCTHRESWKSRRAAEQKKPCALRAV